MSKRTFEDSEATRQAIPVLLGLCGPSGSGKTFSALRLAAGIQRVMPGDIFVLDTEARRALHYADLFKFRHVPFQAPYSPLDYLDAIEYCVAKGAKTIVVDSCSHEHEGPGGVLEMHARNVERLSGGDKAKAERVKMLAWSQPKSDRRRLINTIIGLPVNFILCFRSKEKLKIEKGKDPEQLGYQPIGAEEWIYETTAKLLLLPGSNGVPTLASDYPGEKAMIKIPQQFREVFDPQHPPQITEDVGEKLAKWAAGSPSLSPQVADDALERLLASLSEITTAEDLKELEAQGKALWKRLAKADRDAIQVAVEAARKRIGASA